MEMVTVLSCPSSDNSGVVHAGVRWKHFCTWKHRNRALVTQGHIRSNFYKGAQCEYGSSWMKYPVMGCYIPYFWDTIQIRTRLGIVHVIFRVRK